MSRYTQGEGGGKGVTLRCEQTNLSINCHECHLCATATIAMSNRSASADFGISFEI